jgi:hypothetical protein
VAVEVKTSQYDETLIEKIKTFELSYYDASSKTWFVGEKHVEELKSFLQLPEFLITEIL